MLKRTREEDANAYFLYREKIGMAHPVIVTLLEQRLLRETHNAKSKKGIYDRLSTNFEAAPAATQFNVLTSIINVWYKTA